LLLRWHGCSRCHAVKIDAAGTQVKTYAKEYIKDTTSTVTLFGAVPVTLEGTDVFVGRVQPFNVTIALSTGKFGANTSVTANTAGVNSRLACSARSPPFSPRSPVAAAAPT